MAEAAATQDQTVQDPKSPFEQAVDSELETIRASVNKYRQDKDPAFVKAAMFQMLVLFNDKKVPSDEKFSSLKRILTDESVTKLIAGNPVESFKVLFGPYEDYQDLDRMNSLKPLTSLVGDENKAEAEKLFFENTAIKTFIEERPEKAMALIGSSGKGPDVSENPVVQASSKKEKDLSLIQLISETPDFEGTFYHSVVQDHLKDKPGSEAINAIILRLSKLTTNQQKMAVAVFSEPVIQEYLVEQSDVDKIFDYLSFEDALGHEVTQKIAETDPNIVFPRALSVLETVSDSFIEKGWKALLSDRHFHGWVSQSEENGTTPNFNQFMAKARSVQRQIDNAVIRTGFTKLLLEGFDGLRDSKALTEPYNLTELLSPLDKAEGELVARFAEKAMNRPEKPRRALHEISEEFRNTVGAEWKIVPLTGQVIKNFEQYSLKTSTTTITIAYSPRPVLDQALLKVNKPVMVVSRLPEASV